MPKMTSRKRVFTALEKGVPDQVPIGEIMIDPTIIQVICPGSSYSDFVEEVGLDMVCYEIFSRESININWIDKEKKIYQDKWGAVQRFTSEKIPVCIGPPCIQSEEDLASYVPPDPNQPGLLDSLKEVVNRFKGKKAIAFLGEAVFAPSQYLRGGLTDLFLDYMTRPSFVKKLAKIGEEYYIELCRRVIKEGVEIIILGDDYAAADTTLMSPEHFKSFILPGFRRVVKAIKEVGAYCIKHTDGNVQGIMDDIVATGVDAMGPLQSVPGMELGSVKTKYGDKICVMGNIDVGLLSLGSVDEVVQATKECLLNASPGGGHILSSGNSISSSVKPENFMAMVETVKRWGRYPINVKALSSSIEKNRKGSS